MILLLIQLCIDLFIDYRFSDYLFICLVMYIYIYSFIIIYNLSFFRFIIINYTIYFDTLYKYVYDKLNLTNLI